jgi:hypothetical protein
MQSAARATYSPVLMALPADAEVAIARSPTMAADTMSNSQSPDWFVIVVGPRDGCCGHY